jgi:hypothetical protein
MFLDPRLNATGTNDVSFAPFCSSPAFCRSAGRFSEPSFSVNNVVGDSSTSFGTLVGDTSTSFGNL